MRNDWRGIAAATTLCAVLVAAHQAKAQALVPLVPSPMEAMLSQRIDILQGQEVFMEGQMASMQGQVALLQNQAAALQTLLAALQSQVVGLQGDVAVLRNQAAAGSQGDGQVSAAGTSKSASPATGKTASPSPAASKVTAPFVVVNSGGRVLLRVEDDSGAKMTMYDATGKVAVSIDQKAIMLQNGSGDSFAELAASGGHFGLTVQDGQMASLGVDPNTGALGLRLSMSKKPGTADVSLDLEGGVGNLHLFHGLDQVGLLSVNPGGDGGRLQLNGGSGTARFAAGVSGSEGFAKVVSKAGSAINLGANANGILALRVASTDGGLGSAGMSIAADGSGQVYAGKPGDARAIMRVLNGQGYIAVMNDTKNSVVEVTNDEFGGSVRAANAGGQNVAILEAHTHGGHALLTDNNGMPMVALGASSENSGDACILRGDKPGRCLSQIILPLSIGQ